MDKYTIVIFVLLGCCSSSVFGYHIESISPRNLSYGYSPFWDEGTQSLFFVDFDYVPQCLFRYDFLSKKLYAAGIDNGYTNPSFIIPLKCCNNKFAVSIERTVVIVEWNGIAPLARYIRNATAVEQNQIYDRNHFDRGKPDPRGRLVAGTYTTENCQKNSYPNASFYLIKNNHNIQTLISNIKQTSGFAFNTKRNTFYFVDQCNRLIIEYDWSPFSGHIKNPRVIFDFSQYGYQNYFANELEIDFLGNLCTTLYNGSSIIKLNPRTGKQTRVVKIPVETPTGIGFGGPRLDIVFILSSTNVQDFSQPNADSYPLAPSKYRGQVLMITDWLSARAAAPSPRLNSNYGYFDDPRKSENPTDSQDTINCI